MIDKQALLDQFPDNAAGEIDAVNMRNVINETVDQINQNESDIVDGGDMDAAVYDPQTIEADAFARANHTGTQTLSTISDAGTAAASDSGDFDAAGTAAAGDSAHIGAFAHGNIPTADQKAALDANAKLAAGDAVAALSDIAAAGGGDMLAATYDPQTITADAFARPNHTGTQTLSTISDSGTAAAADVGDFDAAGTAAAGDSAHLSAFNHANILTNDERAGFDAGTAIDATNPPATIDDLPSVVTDHGALGGLADDDHTQYHTDARGDARYAQSTDNSVTNILTVTQAEYDGLTPDQTTLYLICG